MCGKPRQPIFHQMTEAPLDLVAQHGAADPTADDKADPDGLLIISNPGVDDDSGGGSAGAASYDMGELGGPAQPVRSRKHRGNQAASRARPLRRRLPTMARPARVRMRKRKPCVLCRRRLFGWNVRLVTEELPVFEVHSL